MKDFDREKFIYYMTGRTIDTTPFVCSTPAEGEPLLKVEGIGIKDLFDDISFELYPAKSLVLRGFWARGAASLRGRCSASKRFKRGIYP
jgi:simple sugar transport system ATP-binding protein